ncbi:MAG: DUF4410 domain-containing protein [Pseudomonadota bacterium]
MLSFRKCEMLGAVLCFSFLFGCGGTVKYDDASLNKIRQNLKYYDVVVREYKIAPEAGEADGVLAECRAGTIDFLREKKVFRSVGKDMAGTDANTTLFVDARIKDYRIVSGAARFWVGAWAGSSYMVLDVKLTNAATGAVVVQKTIDSHADAMGSAWTGGGTDRSLPRDVGGIIGEYVLDNM